MIRNGISGAQPEEELRGQGGRETVVGEELVASELAAAVASACDSAFSFFCFSLLPFPVSEFFRENGFLVEIRVQRVPQNNGSLSHSRGLR